MGGSHLPAKSKADANRNKLQQRQRTRHRSKQQQHQHSTRSNRKQKQAIKDDDTILSSENLSFCGCGFLGIYHVGVASCFHEYAPQLSMHKIAGASVGALVAVAHICGNLQVAYATTDLLRVAIHARARALGPFHPSFDINALVREALERGLPDDVHERANDRLHISLTRVYDGENVVVSKFDSKEDVIQALICGCFIPFWSGLVAPKYKGVTYIDGGFTNNLLILDGKTVTVSPFSGEADICPQDDVYNLLSICLSNTSISISPHNLYRLSQSLLPPSPEVLSDLCERGFADGIRFLQRKKLISCERCLEIRYNSNFVTYSTTDDEETLNNIQQNHHMQDTIPCDSQYQATTSSTMDYAHDDSGDNEDLTASMILDEDIDCDGCNLRRKNASKDVLPKHFADRIREACETVNKSIYDWFYSHRPIKYLSYIAAPYYLPVDISMALFIKCLRQLPILTNEFSKCVCELKLVLFDIVKRVQENSTTSVLMRPTSLWGDNNKATVKQQQQQQQQQQQESSISVKITADCRRSAERSLTTYKCRLTVVLFGRDISSTLSGRFK